MCHRPSSLSHGQVICLQHEQSLDPPSPLLWLARTRQQFKLRTLLICLSFHLGQMTSKDSTCHNLARQMTYRVICMNHKLFPDTKLSWNDVPYDSLGMDQEAAIFFLYKNQLARQ